MDQLDDDFDQDFLNQPVDQDIDPYYLDDDNEHSYSLDQTTQTFTNDDLHVNEDTRKKINVDFKNKLEKFIPKLYSEDSVKNSEIRAIKYFLEGVKINDQLIEDEINKEKQEIEEQENSRDGRRKRKQTRNTQDSLIEKLKKHMIEGRKLQFILHDHHYTPMYLSHNPCIVYIITNYPYHTLEIINQMLRNLSNSELFEQEKFQEIKQKHGKNCLGLLIQSFQYNHMVVQLPNGCIKFEIKAGYSNQDLDVYKDQVISVYCAINPELKKMCAFLNYWAYQRGILGEFALPEFALYCMVIDFFMTQSLVPNIFTDQYCQWSQEKIRLKKEIKRLDDQRLNDNFTNYEYIIQHIRENGRKAIKIHWLSFPKSKEEIEEVKQIWTKKQEQQNKQFIQPNIGYQISVFFHVWNQQDKYKVPLTFSNDLQHKKDEIGLIIRNPLIQNQNLTPMLVKRQRNTEFISSNLYLQVRKEFQRAYDLIMAGDFAKLCDKQQQIL